MPSGPPAPMPALDFVSPESLSGQEQLISRALGLVTWRARTAQLKEFIFSLCHRGRELDNDNPQG